MPLPPPAHSPLPETPAGLDTSRSSKASRLTGCSSRSLLLFPQTQKHPPQQLLRPTTPDPNGLHVE